MARQMLLKVKVIGEIPGTTYRLGRINYVHAEIPLIGYKVHIHKQVGYYGDHKPGSVHTFKDMAELLTKLKILNVVDVED